jgi:hypothetical protein
MWLTTSAKCGQASRFNRSDAGPSRLLGARSNACDAIRRRVTGCVWRAAKLSLRRGLWPAAIRTESVSRHRTTQPAWFNGRSMPRRSAIFPQPGTSRRQETTWQPTVAELRHPVLLALGTTIQPLEIPDQLRRDWGLSLAKNNQNSRKCTNGFQWSMSTTTGTDQTFTATLPSLTWT